MTKNKLINIGLSLGLAVFITGCQSLDPTPPAVKLHDIEQKMKNAELSLSIEKGESFKKVIARLQEENPDYIIIDKIKDDFKIDRNFQLITTKELKQYLKVAMNKNIVLRKYGKNLISIEEKKKKKKKNFSMEGNYKIPNKQIKVHKNFTYEELFSILRNEKINIYTEFFKENDFLQKEAPEFRGSLKDYLKLIETKEKLFVIKGNSGLIIKDVQTVTYNLKLPKVTLSPALSTSGGDTVVSINTAISGGVGSNSSGGSGDAIDPLTSIDEQIKEMIPEDRVDYHINKTNGSLSVTGDYESMRIVDMLVEDYQSIYDTAIKIEMHMYQVKIDNDNAFGIDYNVLKSELLGDSIVQTVDFATGLTDGLSSTAVSSGNVSYTNNTGLVVSTDSSVSVTEEDNTTTLSTNNTSAAKKSEGFIFKYLNKFGKTKVVTKPTLGTINNLPVSLDVVDSVDYVAKIEKGSDTSSTDSGLSTSSSSVDIDVETVTTGYSIVLHPKIDGDYVQIALKNVTSVLNSLDAYTYVNDGEENTMYLKNVSAREFNETVKIKEGEIAIIGGFMFESQASTKNGLPFTDENDSVFDAVTSAKENIKDKFEVVITLTATIL